MVVTKNIKDILGLSCKNSSVTLPSCKEIPLDLKFMVADEGVTTSFLNGKEPPLPFASSEIFHADIFDWRRLTEVDESCKAVYEVSFDTTGSNFQFKPGDTIGIVPHNNNAEVNEIIDHLNLSAQADLEYTLSISGNQKGKIQPHIPVRSTIRHVLTHCCDIRSVMKKLFILALTKHTKEENERRILEYLCSKEGSSAYNAHILNEHFCILDLFSIFKSCKPPIEVLLAYLPRLLPRPYSIVNSGLVNCDVIKICFSVTELDNNRKGIATGWMERLINNETDDIELKMKSLCLNGSTSRCKVPIYLRKNMTGFRLPEDVKTPLILIGPGTGVAPFIGFLEERQYLKENNPEAKLSEAWVFFGCRNPKLDYIYEEELNEYLNNGVISNLSTSFSRVENSNTKYIQDALLANSKDIVQLVNKGAAIFVCGDLNNMASQVKDTLVSCFVSKGKSRQDAEALLSDLHTGRRYLVDAWS